MFTRLQKRSIVQRAWFIPVCAVFAVVCWIATAASQSAPRQKAPQNAETFTLTGEIPAHSALRATAQYNRSGSAHSCNYPPVTVHHDTLPDANTQPFSFAIALSYSLPECQMLLGDVNLTIDGFYGSKHEQHSATSAGTIAVRSNMSPQLKNGVPGFPASGEKEYRGVCDWLTVAATEEGQAESKRLNCQAADKNWKVSNDRQRLRHPGGAVGYQELAGKTIRVTLRMAEPAG